MKWPYCLGHDGYRRCYAFARDSAHADSFVKLPLCVARDAARHRVGRSHSGDTGGTAGSADSSYRYSI